MIEREEITEWLIFLLAWGWMFVSQIAFKDRQTVSISQFVGMGLAFGVLLGKNVVRQVQATHYTFLKADVSPPDKIIDLPVVPPPHWNFHSVRNPLAPNLWTTPLNLGEKKTIGEYVGVERIHVTHLYPLTDRLSPTSGVVTYRGERVTHRAVCNVVLWRNEFAPVSMEDSAPEPNFVLVTASRADRHNDEMRRHLLAQALGASQYIGFNLKGQPPKVRRLVDQLVRDNKRLVRVNAEKDLRINQLMEATKHWRTRDISDAGRAELGQEEIVGLMERKPNLESGVDRRITSKVASIDDIYQLGEQYKWWKNANWPVIGAVICVGLVLAFLWSRTDVREGIGRFASNTTNQVVLLVLAGAIVSGLYLLRNMLQRK